MKKISYFTMIALLIMGVSYASDSKLTTMTNENEKAAKIDKLVKYSYEHGMFNGTILVSENGNVIYKKAFGYADFKTKELLKPQSSNVYDSLGEAYMADGQTALAIKNYEKTLSLNNSNQWAKSQLVKLKSKD